jgi:erythromycin esterase-like protein
MTTADSTNTTAIAFSVEALRYRILAAEADINALIAVRATDTELIQRTEATYRGLIVKQDRYRRLVRQLVRRLEVAQ